MTGTEQINELIIFHIYKKSNIHKLHTWLTFNLLIYFCVSRCIYSDFDPTRAYALSKLAIVLHTKEVAQRLKVVIYYSI